MLLLYSFSIRIYMLLISIAALFNSKAKAWISGRRNQRTKPLPNANIWVHCASLGEYEQVRPILRKIRQNWPTKTICLSFFSPSGFEHVSQTDEFTFKAYIPIDTSKAAKYFINQINPDFVILVKNDFWYNHIQELGHRRIPFITVSTTVRPHSFFLKAYANVFRHILKSAKAIYVQDEKSIELLKRNGFNNGKLAGDTRIDQVVQLANEVFQDSKIENFKAEEKLFILASTHEEDDRIYLPILKELATYAKVLIAPHDVDEKRIKMLMDKIQLPVLRYSHSESINLLRSRILILDNIGILSRAYRYADMVYIGGGFGNGIHNTLEPAAYGLPLCFGPKYNKFREAIYFLEHNLAVLVSDQKTLAKAIHQGLDDKKIDSLKAAYQRYFKIFGGGSEKIIQFIKSNQYLT